MSIGQKHWPCVPVFLPLLLSVTTAAGLFGQGLTGRLSATVVDASGAMVANADVTVTNVETRQARSAKTDDAGYFSFNELLPGSYNLAVSAPGFNVTNSSQFQ